MSTGNNDTQEKSPETGDKQPRPAVASSKMRGLGIGFWVSATFMVIVLVGGLTAYVVGREDTTAASGGGAPATAPPQTDRGDWGLPYTDELGRRVEVPPSPDGAALEQNVADRKPADDTTSAPGGLQWQQIRTYPLPFSTTDGPTGIDGRMATGFAQTPRGAALAGIQLYTRGGATNAGAAEFYTNRVVPDSDPLEQLRREFLRRANDAVAAGEGDKLALLPYFRVVAYRIVQWSPERPDYAKIEYAMLKESGTGWISTPMELLWRGGDWQIKLTADLYGGQKDLSNIGGWTQWPAT